MYFGPVSLREAESVSRSPGAGPLPYREAMEETERRQWEEYSRDCQGVRMIETLQRTSSSPLEQVQHAERVLRVMPAVFRLKREGEARVRRGTMSYGQLSATISELLTRMGFPQGYALSSEADEIARARCALSKARWQFMVFQRTGRVPGERRLLHGVLGQAPQARGCARNPIDANAAAIIAAARDQAQPIDVRGRELIRTIIRTYFPSDAPKVSGVQYVEVVRDRRGNTGPLPGLETTSEGAGPTARGLIRVGRPFVEGTNDTFFARRVLQVGHEIRHIDQWRAGMVGPARKAEREFLAHRWTAITPELPGTGCMPHATRVAIIDAALGNFNCLSAANRTRYVQLQSALLALRQQEQAASGNPATAPPAACAVSS